jgi:hypothetical protein
MAPEEVQTQAHECSATDYFATAVVMHRSPVESIARSRGRGCIDGIGVGTNCRELWQVPE